MKILITGAAGQLGLATSEHLAAQGHELLLTDCVVPARDIPGTTFVCADLRDGEKIAELCADVQAIVHLGGLSLEDEFDRILDINVRGTWHVYEGARRAGAHVILASSNHAFGFHPRTQSLAVGCDFRPDSYYGWSKASKEAMARLYWDKHGVPSSVLRIGSCFPEPSGFRHLSTWFSPRDYLALVDACLSVVEPGYRIFWGVSENRARWWYGDEATRAGIGFQASESVDAWRAQLPVKADGADALVEYYQGGDFCRIGYSRRPG